MGFYTNGKEFVQAFKWTGDINQVEDPIWIIEKIKDGEVDFAMNEITKQPIMYVKSIVEGEPNIVVNSGDWVVLENGKLLVFEENWFRIFFDEVTDEYMKKTLIERATEISATKTNTDKNSKFTEDEFKKFYEKVGELDKMRDDMLQEYYKAEQAIREKEEAEALANPLSQYSITQLKEEIRRRKGKNGKKQVIRY